MTFRTRTPLHLAALRSAYAAGDLDPARLVDELLPALDASEPLHIWTARLSADELRDAARALGTRPDPSRPLWGVPFAVKDNTDVAGLPTAAACPGFAYQPERSATAVERLLAAGGLLVGKTNMDQLASGLVGLRSPHGAPPNPFDDRYVPGGSSSGSAGAVARGLVTFALGTDTAGSARAPAAFTNTVGLKPSRGLLSLRGVVPACRSIDCLSVQSLTVEDAAEVARAIAGPDPGDPYSRPSASPAIWRDQLAPSRFRFGVPGAADHPLGDAETEAAFERAVAALTALGGTPVAIDMSPFYAAGRLLYEGPWIAERLAELEAFVNDRPEAILPVTRQILQGGAAVRGTAVFLGLHRLEALRAAVHTAWSAIDLLVVPTTPTIATVAEIEARPIEANAALGRYTTFANLLDLAALAVPNGFRADGLPTGVSLIGPWGSDGRLAALGAAFHRRVGGRLGATPWSLAAEGAAPPAAPRATGDELPIAVVGAHLAGQPLNHQLTDRGARLLAATRTAPAYRLHALPTAPPRPGLVRDTGGGAAIEIEVWAVPLSAVGSFVAQIPAPLCLGQVELDDGTWVTGFLCEPHALVGAPDITERRGWRAYLAGG